MKRINKYNIVKYIYSTCCKSHMIKQSLENQPGFACTKCGLWLSVVEKEHGVPEHQSTISRRDKPKHDITKQSN